MKPSTAHDTGCPDQSEIAGPHACCPCPHCMDTGRLGADLTEIECDCGAELQPDEETYAEIIRLNKIGSLVGLRFVEFEAP